MASLLRIEPYGPQKVRCKRRNSRVHEKRDVPGHLRVELVASRAGRVASDTEWVPHAWEFVNCVYSRGRKYMLRG